MDNNLPEEIVAKLFRRIDQPLAANTICFTLTTRCNLRCKYCFNYALKYHEDMQPELAVAILDAYLRYQQEHHIEIQLRHLVFWGGEPTLNPEAIFAITNYINQHHIRCLPRLTTNGVIKKSLLERLIAEKFLFQISFDGQDNSLRKTATGASIEKPVLQTIRSVAAAGLPIMLRATITANNVENMLDIVRFAADNNVETVSFAPLFLVGQARQHALQQPDLARYVHNYLAAMRLAKELQVDFFSLELLWYRKGKNKLEYPPLVFLPTGELALTIKHASAQAVGADKVIVGGYDSQEKKLKLNFAKIKEMAYNYTSNCERYCRQCLAFDYCMGRNKSFDIFALNKNGAPDNYFCELTRSVLKYITELGDV